MKTLVAYYSRAGENYVCGQIKKLAVGNTEKIAEKIAAETGGELFKIEQKTPYSTSYNTCIAQAQQEQRENARPALVKYADFSDYDVIFLGYPNYWNTVPMAVFSFLEQGGLNGQILCPFCTHEGSGFGGSIGDLERHFPGAKLLPGLSVRGCKADSADRDIKEWLEKLQNSMNRH